MTSLYDAKTTDLLPDNLKNEKEEAFALAVRDLYRNIMDYAKKSNIYSTMSMQSDDVLNLMAAEFRTLYYEESLSHAEKVDLIQNSLKWYAYAGKPLAVREMGEKIFGICEVLEAWQYGGDPFMFKISVNTEYTQDILSRFTQIMERVKPTGTTLEGVETVANAEMVTEFANTLTKIIYNQPIEMEVN